MLIAGEPPPLSAEEAAHGAKVAAHIRALIAAEGGWLPFSRFMREALYAPGLGYYVAGRQPFGAGGDFVTAPELSPLFARCLARQVAEVLQRAGGGDIVEFGAGSGLLAAELLEALARLDALPRRYRIVEISAPLRAMQRERIDRLRPDAVRVDWLDEAPADAWQGVAIANEFLDALPVDRFRIAAAGIETIGVVAEDEDFAWRARPADAALSAVIGTLSARLPEKLPAGYVSEWCPTLPAWLSRATGQLSCGALLIADYGLPRAQYYHASRDGGFLCGFHRHRRVDDALVRPGLQDLTAWVDFSAVAQAAQSAGLEIAGFTTQAHFLASLGIERELAALVAAAGEAGRPALTQGAQTLLLPGEMGERFKAMALTRDLPGPLAGFRFRDFSASL